MTPTALTNNVGGGVCFAPAAGVTLSPGQGIDISASSYDRSCVAGRKSGTYSYIYHVDPDNKVVGSNKDSNTTTCSFVVTSEMLGSSLPSSFDLAVTSVVAKPATGPAATTKFAFDIVVKNVGSGEAPAFAAQCELDLNKIG